MCFSKNTATEVWASILGVWQVDRDVAHDKYLGLPSFIGRSKKQVFNGIKNWV